jgi:dihydroorotate dehydrogenase
MYKLLIRPILFWFDPEKIHYFTFSLIRNLSKIPGFASLFKSLYEVNDPRLEVEVFGLKFKNPVGLAAGFDKDAKLYQELSNFGFGFIEIGTLTPKPQDGNPKKRLFRLKKDSAIINRMGFNNGGVQDAVARLKKNKKVLIGGNIGKNKLTPNENAIQDYEICFNQLYDYVDYFAKLTRIAGKRTANKVVIGITNPEFSKRKTKTNLAKNCSRFNQRATFGYYRYCKSNQNCGRNCNKYNHF